MNEEHEEKLGILSQLIKLSRADKFLDDAEFTFLHAIGNLLNLPEEEITNLIIKPGNYPVPKTEGDRILQFQRMMLMIQIDHTIVEEEIIHLKNAAIAMGLNPQATDEMLIQMKKYENGMIPPEKVVSIFNKYHN